jgi:hypothetical protein
MRKIEPETVRGDERPLLMCMGAEYPAECLMYKMCGGVIALYVPPPSDVDQGMRGTGMQIGR